MHFNMKYRKFLVNERHELLAQCHYEMFYFIINITSQVGIGLQFAQLFVQLGYTKAQQNFLTPLAFFLFQMPPNV